MECPCRGGVIHRLAATPCPAVGGARCATLAPWGRCALSHASMADELAMREAALRQLLEVRRSGAPIVSTGFGSVRGAGAPAPSAGAASPQAEVRGPLRPADAFRRTGSHSLARVAPGAATSAQLARTVAAPVLPTTGTAATLLPPRTITAAADAAPGPTRRVVHIPVAFESTANGRGLRRKRDASAASAVPAVSSISFKQRRLAAAQREAKGRTPCTTFCRTGRCDATRDCPYEHDPQKVAICQAYLHGECRSDLVDCSLSHAPTPQTMPVCRLYARSLCVDVACAWMPTPAAPRRPTRANLPRRPHQAAAQPRHACVCAAAAAAHRSLPARQPRRERHPVRGVQPLWLLRQGCAVHAPARAAVRGLCRARRVRAR